MPPAARLGDKSSHGGIIITASSDIFVDGIPIARTGDLHECPIHGHGITPLTSSSTVHMDGRSVIRIGDKAGCGATIIQGSPDVNAE
jgi:uncharacterized Zn-binding protein involved in type VI secretion